MEWKTVVGAPSGSRSGTTISRVILALKVFIAVIIIFDFLAMISVILIVTFILVFVIVLYLNYLVNCHFLVVVLVIKSF